MNVLAIESSGPISSVTACRDDAVLAEKVLEGGMDHGRMLMGLIDRVVGLAGWDKRNDPGLIAVSRGPGSYTGLRVGIACAKTLASLLDKPLVGVCSLDALAENAPPDCDHVLTVLDAKRGQVYAAAYERRDGRFSRTAGPGVMTPSAALKFVEPPACAIGDGVARFRKEFSPPACRPLPEGLWRVRARMVARLGLVAFREGRREDPAALEPIYLRLPEAEERRLARERGAP